MNSNKSYFQSYHFLDHYHGVFFDELDAVFKFLSEDVEDSIGARLKEHSIYHQAIMGKLAFYNVDEPSKFKDYAKRISNLINFREFKDKIPAFIRNNFEIVFEDSEVVKARYESDKSDMVIL